MPLHLSEVTTITVDENHHSVFAKKSFPLTARGGMSISEQQDAVNFRYRTSPQRYESDWHIAGDPTLIIVTTGTIELELRDGSKKQFHPGEKFIAEDYLPYNTPFDSSSHGHKARVIGEQEFTSVHIKLEKRNDQ